MNPGQLTLMGTTLCVMRMMHFAGQLLSEHMMSWKKSKEQKVIIVIILMAPMSIFAGANHFLCSWTRSRNVMKLCYLNISISKNIVPDNIKEREIHHSFPMTLFQPHTVRLNHQTLKLLKYWTWQFVVIRPVCSILMIALQLLEIYPSWVSWTFTFILNISVSLALYSLVVFYHVFAKELEPHKPLAKFLCIKGIVFFCFWQGVLLDILVALGIIKSHYFWLDVEQIEEALQNALVCVEMVFFSAFQQYAYRVAPYRDDDTTPIVKDKKND